MCTFKITVVCLLVSFVLSKDEKITYFATERVKIVDVNTKYLTHVSAKSVRRNRQDPIYYFELKFGTKVTLDNNYTASFYFYEWLTNTYKRGFIEMHMKWCDMINKDIFFGTAFRNVDAICPTPPGEYDIQNCTIPTSAIPKTFPFTKGRIYANLTLTSTREVVGAGHVDFELKQMKKKKN